MAITRMLYKAFRTYKTISDKAFSPKYLLHTNILLSVSISTFGDLLEQSYELHRRHIDKYDVERTSQMGASGGTAGLICHHWYNFLDRVITGRSIKNILKKLLLDQCVCSPIIILSFFATVALFEDNPIQTFNEEVSEKFWKLYKAEWIVWPPAQIVNFYFLPTKYRVVYDNTISLGYDIYTSQIKHSKDHKPKMESDKSAPNN